MSPEKVKELIEKYEAAVAPTVFRIDVLRDLYYLRDGVREIPRLR